VTETDPKAPPAPEAWHALRALLSGATAVPPPSAALAHAAILGELEVLAHDALPELAPWLGAAVRCRTEQSVVVGFAEARVAEVMAAASAQRWTALKGSASAHTLYSDSSHRARRDVDILVHPDDISGVSQAARDAGWEEVTHATHLAGSAQNPFEREWMVPLGGHRVGCDVHRRLLRWTEFRVDVAEVLERSETLASGWRVCARSDLLVHTALHAANAAFRVPLRSWLDVQRMVTSPTLDWEHVLRTSRAWHAQRCVWAALLVCERWFGVAPPEAVMQQLSPEPRIRARLGRRLEGQGRWPGTRQLGRIGRAHTRMLLRDTPSDAWSYVWQTVIRELSERRDNT
jgi:hypothetical protein